MVRFLVAEGAATRHKVEKLWNAVGRIILLHDNARVHTASLVRDTKISLENTLTSSVQSRSFPLCLPHFWRPEEKHSLSSVSFGRGSARVGDEVPDWVRLWIHQLPTSFYKTGIDHLVSLWGKFINTSGNYF